MSKNARIAAVLNRCSTALRGRLANSDAFLQDLDTPQDNDDLALLRIGGNYLGLDFHAIDIKAADAIGFLQDHCVVVAVTGSQVFWVFEQLSGRRIEASRIDNAIQNHLLSRREVRKVFNDSDLTEVFVGQRQLAFEDATSQSLEDQSQTQVDVSHAHSAEQHEHHHVSPLRRLFSLLKMDQRDIWTILLFALVAGILAMATPLAVESLVNVVSWGTFLQPLLVLGSMLLACLGIAGFLKILQAVIVENIQRRQFVRFVGDLTHRFPQADRRAIVGEYPRELSNRVFDILTIQKSTAGLLMDGISILLTTTIGLMLLAFYHPFLLGFDIVLVSVMVCFTWLLGRGGIRTSIDESIMKYRVFAWLQDVIDSPSAFGLHGGRDLAVQRSNQLTAEYIFARQRQFRVLLRQITFAIILQAIASTVLLGLGGWLVMRQQLTLGQLVASELVVTVVVSAFAKAGKSLEIFYDLMSGLDKVGHLIDIPTQSQYVLNGRFDAPPMLRWDDLHFENSLSNLSCHVGADRIEGSSCVALVGEDWTSQHLLLRSIAGLEHPHSGLIQINRHQASDIARSQIDSLVAYVGTAEIFHGTLAENISLQRASASNARLRSTLADVDLLDEVLRMPAGIKTLLQSGGYPLDVRQKIQLTIARAIVVSPQLLVIDRALDELNPTLRWKIWSAIKSSQPTATILIATSDQRIIESCDRSISL